MEKKICKSYIVLLLVFLLWVGVSMTVFAETVQDENMLEELTPKIDTIVEGEETTDANEVSVVNSGYSFNPETRELVIESNEATTAWRSDSMIVDLSAVKSVIISEGVTDIGKNAFAGCDELISVSIPNSVISIEYGAFQQCGRISSITIPGSVEAIGMAAFGYCSSLTEVVIEEGVPMLSASMFWMCSSLTEITIPASVSLIQNGAFYGCSSLALINVLRAEEPIIEIGNTFVFDNTSPLLVISVPQQTVQAYKADENWSAYSRLIKGDNDIVIEAEMKKAEAALQSIIPSNETTAEEIEKVIREAVHEGVTISWKTGEEFRKTEATNETGGRITGTFLMCYKEISREISIDFYIYRLDGGMSGDGYSFDVQTGELVIESNEGSLNWRGDNRFGGKSAVKSVTIKTGVTEIRDQAFEGCEQLLSASLPNTVTSIGFAAFQSCTRLSSITIPSSVQKVAAVAFQNCTSLSEVTLEEGVAVIGASMFWQCTSLTEITIPSSVRKIHNGAFYGCQSLELVRVLREEEPITALGDTLPFYDTSPSLVIVVPQKRLLNYKFGANWQFDYGARIVGSEDSVINEAKETADKKLEEYVVTNNTTAADIVEYLQKSLQNNCTVSWKPGEAFEKTEATDKVEGKVTGTLMLTYGSVNRYVQLDKKILVIKKVPPVQNLKAQSAGKNKVKLSWEKSIDAEGYLVYAQKDGKYGYCGMTTTGTDFVDVKALDSAYNFYWVFPYYKDDAGKMIPSGCDKYVYSKGVCLAVTGLKATSLKGNVKLTWTASQEAEGYLIYGKTASGKYGYIGMTTKGVTFTDKKASNKEYNFYWVYPYHKDKNGGMIVGGTPKYVYGKSA